MLIPCAAFGQTAGISLPSAYTTFTIAGTGGSVSSKFSMLALAVTPDVLWQSASNGGHYLEVISVGGSTSAAGVGTTYTISATTASSKTITIATSLASGVSGTVGYRGSNTTGLAPGTSTTGDQVLVWNGTTNSFDA